MLIGQSLVSHDGLNHNSVLGLTIVLARAESPIVNGYFCLATEVRALENNSAKLKYRVF